MSDSRVIVRPLVAGDCEAFLEAAHRSREFHEPWIHPPLTPDDFNLYLERFEDGENESRLVCLPESGELVGLINLNNIIRGYFQNSFLGFYAFENSKVSTESAGADSLDSVSTTMAFVGAGIAYTWGT